MTSKVEAAQRIHHRHNSPQPHYIPLHRWPEDSVAKFAAILQEVINRDLRGA